MEIQKSEENNKKLGEKWTEACSYKKRIPHHAES